MTKLFRAKRGSADQNLVVLEQRCADALEIAPILLNDGRCRGAPGGADAVQQGALDSIRPAVGRLSCDCEPQSAGLRFGLSCARTGPAEGIDASQWQRRFGRGG